MSDREVLLAIDRFINRRFFHYALLINGSWGCGKTFFIDNALVPHIREELKMDVNYVSLYGISSVDAINEALSIQAIKDKIYTMFNIKVDGKVGEISSVAGSFFFKNILPKLGIGESEPQKILSILPDYSNNVIIFDDLERCGLEINEVLGYINGFIEHTSAAVILVANEKEIGNWQLERNPELQMQIALSENLRVPIQKSKGRSWDKDGYYQGRNSDKREYTIEQLEERRAKIFHRNNKYLRMKEKVIGQTINYIPNLKVAYMELIEKVQSNTNLSNQLKEMVEGLVDYAVKSHHYNLRTFQFFLEKLCTIYEAIENHYTVLDYTIITYTFQSSIRCMKGLDMPKWEGDYGTQFFEEGINILDKSIVGFRFIDELVYKNVFDLNLVNRILTQYKTTLEEQGRLRNDPYQLIQSWWYSEDSEVIQWLDEIKGNVKRGKYSTMLYPDIVKQLAAIKSYGIMESQCDSVIKAMKTYIRNTDPHKLLSFGRVHFLPEGESGKIYSETIKELNTLMEGKIGQSERLKYKERLQSENWSMDLIVKESFIEGHSFIYCIQPEDLLERISRACNSELQNFRNALQSVYSEYVTYRMANEDLEHLSELKEGISKLDTSQYGEIKRLYIRWIEGDIERYIKRIKEIEIVC